MVRASTKMHWPRRFGKSLPKSSALHFVSAEGFFRSWDKPTPVNSLERKKKCFSSKRVYRLPHFHYFSLPCHHTTTTFLLFSLFHHNISVVFPPPPLPPPHFYCFPSSTTTTTFPLFSLFHHHHISIRDSRSNDATATRTSESKIKKYNFSLIVC